MFMGEVGGIISYSDYIRINTYTTKGIGHPQHPICYYVFISTYIRVGW